MIAVLANGIEAPLEKRLAGKIHVADRDIWAEFPIMLNLSQNVLFGMDILTKLGLKITIQDSPRSEASVRTPSTKPTLEPIQALTPKSKLASTSKRTPGNQSKADNSANSNARSSIVPGVNLSTDYSSLNGLHPGRSNRCRTS